MSNLNKLTGKVSLGKAFPFAFQQVLAMFVANLVPIVLVCSAAGMSGDQILTFSQNAMIIAGIATFIQSTPFGVIGSGLPLVMGASFTFVVSLSAIAAKHGYGAVMGSVIAGGIWASFPPIVQSIFAQNVVAVIFVMSFLLNLVLPADMEDHNAR